MAGKKIPVRECVGCRQLKEKREMLRILHTPDGAYTVDATGRKNGRGAYLCRSQECFEKAVKSRGLERSFHTSISPAVYEALAEALAAQGIGGTPQNEA